MRALLSSMGLPANCRLRIDGNTFLSYTSLYVSSISSFNCGNLVGADILDLSHISLPNTKIKICDQSNREDLQKLIDTTYGIFDIIIDDGGHMMHQQQITLGYMFPFLASGGIFVIEDLHTCGNPSYTREGDTDTLHMLQIFQSTRSIISNCMTIDEIEYLNNNIDTIYIEKGNVSDIAFIIKK
jgi:hypothetical protein